MVRTGLVLFVSLVLVAPALAEREFVDRIPNGGVYDCDNCHESSSFRKDWERFGWGGRLAQEDSDGDGFSNGEELQDPSGSWRPGQADPGKRSRVSDPSDKRSVPPASGAPSKNKARCIRKLNEGLVQVAEAAGAALRGCVEQAAADAGAEAPSVCAADLDLAPKVVKRVARLEDREERDCLALPSPPPFGATSAEAVAAAAIEERAALLEDLFGPDPDAALLSDVDDAQGARCQRAWLGAADRCAGQALDAFELCKKKGLQASRIGGVDDLLACLDKALAGKRAKRCGPDGSKLSKTLAKRCSEPGTDLSSLFPGCDEASPEGLAACTARQLRCRACRAVDAADDLGADCDRFDDASANGSCDD